MKDFWGSSLRDTLTGYLNKIQEKYRTIQDEIPSAVKEKCVEYGNNPDHLERYLNECVNQGLIRESDINVLMQTFTAECIGSNTMPAQAATVCRCPVCGHYQEAGFKYCTKCGSCLEAKGLNVVDTHLEKTQCLFHSHTEQMPITACIPEAEPTTPVCAEQTASIVESICEKTQPVAEQQQRQGETILSQKQPKTAVEDEYQKELGEAIRENYPGMRMFVRDAALKPEIAAMYKPGIILRERAYVDATAWIGGMKTTHRFVILSNHMTSFERFEHGKKLRLHCADRDSHFKVLGVHTFRNKTAIFLLHLPDNSQWKLFRDVKTDMDKQLLADCIRRFEEKCLQVPIDVVSDEEWLSRCQFPLGLDDHGRWWSLE